MKFWRALEIALVALVLVAIPVFASGYWHILPVYVDIVEGPRELGFYSNDNFTGNRTIELQISDFGRGTSYSVPLWLRNDGVETMEITSIIEPDNGDFSWGWVRAFPQYLGTLATNETTSCNISIWVNPDAPLGEVFFTVNFTDIREP